jgi:peptidyl-tRNA hydrolase, PTH2 family
MSEGHFEIKQVIVIRKDLKMRRGKEIAQGSHASIAWLTKRLRWPGGLNKQIAEKSNRLDLSQEEIDWINGSFAKVCCQVNSKEELMEIQRKAKDAGLTVELITDSGKTEFGGQPTPTCLAIGPHKAEKIDPITGDLELY